MFNNHAEELKTVSTNTNVRKLYTGLGNVYIHAINPTEKQLTELIGEAAKKFDTSYEAKESIRKDGTEDLSINLWLSEDGESYFLQSFNISKEPHVAMTGSFRFINDQLNSTYSTSLETITTNERMSWFCADRNTGAVLNPRQARVGEILYYNFIANVINWNMREKYDELIPELKKEGLDFDTVLNGNFNGLHKLVDFYKGLNEAEHFIHMPFCVREATNGNMRQEVLFNEDLMFKYNNTGRFEKLHNEKVADGREFKAGREYTIALMEYDPKAVLQKHPDDVATEANDDLPF